MRKFALPSLAVFAAVALFVGVGLYIVERVIGANVCDVEIQRSVTSPSGRLNVIAFEMACGATVQFNRQFSIAPANAPFSPKKFPPFLIVSGDGELSIRWISDQSLEVALPRDEKSFRKHGWVGNVEITYLVQ